MDVQRAQEIVNSPAMIKVTYNESLVYIEHVDQEKQLATVHPLNNPTSKQSVSVTKLQEQ